MNSKIYKSKLDLYTEEIKELYINGKSTKEIREIIKNKYSISLSSEIYRRKIKKLNIIRNRSEAIKLSSRKHIDKDKILKEYNSGRAIRQLSRENSIGRGTIKKILKESEYIIRNSRDSLIKIGHIKEKTKFNLSPQEKAYLFGLVGGDLSPVKKSNFTLKLITHTTHPAFAQLLQDILEKYGVFSANINKNNEFRCSSYLDLESFAFLLDSKRETVPEWINNENFFYYLAGFIDSDGCVTIKRAYKHFQFAIKFCGENLKLLNEVKNQLENLGYRLSIHKNHEKGDFSYHQGKKITYNKDYYVIEVSNKPNVIKLLNLIPIRHPEKIAKRNLIFEIHNKNLIYWKDVESEVLKLRLKIKTEVKNRLTSHCRLELIS